MLSEEDRLKLVIPITNLGMVKQLCSLIDVMRLAAPDGCLTERMQWEGMFVYSLVWSVGAALLAPSRVKFNDFLATLYSDGGGKNLYDHYYNVETMSWVEWKTMIPEYKQPSPFKFYQIVVPTADTVMYNSLLETLGKTSTPTLFVGLPGTAKTTIISDYIYGKPANETRVLNINMSSRTSSLDVQRNIEDSVEKRSGKIYGPPAGKKLMVFIDDMNMPKVDTYGTQQPIALLHFLVGRSSMYGRGKD